MQMAIDPTVSPTTNAGVPVPTQTAPNPAAAAPPDVQDTSAPGGPDLAVAPAGPPPPKPNQNIDVNAHHAMIGKIFSTIAGGQTTDYANTPDGPVPVKRDLRPGEIARNILGSALSLMAAGAGGAQAGLQGKQYRQDPNQTIGGMEKARIQTREQQAQKVFENRQASDEQTLRAHKDAREQQEAIAAIRKDQDEHEAAVQAREIGSRALDERSYQSLKEHAKDYSDAMAMPGAEVMKDAKGNEMNFLNAGEAQAYATAHPEVLHGSTNGNSKYGVIPVVNPYTGMIQLVDYPAERHDIGVANFGQKKDKNGDPVFAADGSPVPDGTVLDPKTKKPTVLTQTVTPQQAADIRKQSLTEADIEAQMEQRGALADRAESEARKNDELSEATDLYDMGNFEKMTDRQKQLVARMTFQQQTLLSNRESKAAERLAKAQQTSTGDNDPDVVRAQKEYDAAKDEYEDAADKYNKLTGNTQGVQLANKIIRGGIGKINWPDVDKEITSSGLPDNEQQAAKAKVWNAMSPAQQAAASGKAAPATNPAAAAPAIIYNPQGQAMQVPANLVDKYLTDPKYAGWHK